MERNYREKMSKKTKRNIILGAIFIAVVVGVYFLTRSTLPQEELVDIN